MPIVRILTAIAGLDFSWTPGDELVFTAEAAALWCDGVRVEVVGPTPDEQRVLDAAAAAELPAVAVSVDGVDMGPGEVVSLPDNGVTFAPLPEVVEGQADELTISVPDYSGCTVPQLRAVLEGRGLATDGKRPELLARLEAADAVDVAELTS